MTPHIAHTLHPPEMLDAVPASVAPGPAAPLGAEHEHHDEAYARNERQQRTKVLLPMPQIQLSRKAPQFQRSSSGGISVEWTGMRASLNFQIMRVGNADLDIIPVALLNHLIGAQQECLGVPPDQSPSRS